MLTAAACEWPASGMRPRCQMSTAYVIDNHSLPGALLYVAVYLVRMVYEDRLKLAVMVTIFVCSGGHHHIGVVVDS